MYSHNLTGVTSGVSLTKKIEFEFEQDMVKTDYKIQKYV